jgi:glyoxylase-like metal-dependent hydrolase (beta-lactamase superfamily II)
MTELDWFLLEAGYCLHPEASVQESAPWRVCEFPALVTVMRHPGKGWILFDTGYGEAFLRATRKFPESLYRAVTPVKFSPQQAVIAQLHAKGLQPTDIKMVMVSHFHGDHVGGLVDFAHADVWCSVKALDDLNARSRLSALIKGLLPELVPDQIAKRMHFFETGHEIRLPPDFAPFTSGFELLEDGSLIAIPLPGHAVGHFGVCFKNAGRWIFLVGDAAWSMRAIKENLPPPRWTTALLGDTDTYQQTLAKLNVLATRNSGVTLIPSHCRERRP